MRPLFCLTLSALCACATAGSPTAEDPMVGASKVTSIGSPNEYEFTPSGPSSATTLEFPAQRVWDLVPSIYTVLSIPIVGIDTAGQRIVGSITARRSYRDQPVSNFLDCGSSIAGPHADNSRVTIKLSTQVASAGPATSRVRTIVEATGVNSAGASMRCSSTGTLESTILTRLREGLSR